MADCYYRDLEEERQFALREGYEFYVNTFTRIRQILESQPLKWEKTYGNSVMHRDPATAHTFFIPDVGKLEFHVGTNPLQGELYKPWFTADFDFGFRRDDEWLPPLNILIHYTYDKKIQYSRLILEEDGKFRRRRVSLDLEGIPSVQIVYEKVSEAGFYINLMPDMRDTLRSVIKQYMHLLGDLAIVNFLEEINKILELSRDLPEWERHNLEGLISDTRFAYATNQLFLPTFLQ